jgi:hypothetical protein
MKNTKPLAGMHRSRKRRIVVPEAMSKYAVWRVVFAFALCGFVATALLLTGCESVTGSANQTPAVGDFNIGGLEQTYDGSPRPVSITPQEGRSGGTITVFYEGAGETVYERSTTAPIQPGTYIVTFDVGAASGFNAVFSLLAGTLTIHPAVDPVLCEVCEEDPCVCIEAPVPCEDCGEYPCECEPGSADAGITLNMNSFSMADQGEGKFDETIILGSSKPEETISLSEGVADEWRLVPGNILLGTDGSLTLHASQFSPGTYTITVRFVKDGAPWLGSIEMIVE